MQGRLSLYDGLLEVGCFKQRTRVLLTEKHNINQGCQATCIYVTAEF